MGSTVPLQELITHKSSTLCPDPLHVVLYGRRCHMKRKAPLACGALHRP